MEACLRVLFDVPAAAEDDDEECCVDLSNANHVQAQIIYHEAGHAVASEILCPGSVTLVTAYDRSGTRGGFTNYYNDNSYVPMHWVMSRVVSSLGGIAAVEQKYGVYDLGGRRDLDQAFDRMKDLVGDNCVCGLHLHSYGYGDANSEQLRTAQEQATATEIEKAYRKAKEILAANMEFVEKVAAALARKRLLSATDIKKIKDDCKIVPVAL